MSVAIDSHLFWCGVQCPPNSFWSRPLQWDRGDQHFLPCPPALCQPRGLGISHWLHLAFSTCNTAWSFSIYEPHMCWLWSIQQLAFGLYTLCCHRSSKVTHVRISDGPFISVYFSSMPYLLFYLLGSSYATPIACSFLFYFHLTTCTNRDEYLCNLWLLSLILRKMLFLCK